MQVSHRLAAESAVFDEDNLVPSAGLVPVMTLAEQTGLGRLLGEKVQIMAPRIKYGSANPAPKLATVMAGMCAGADCIQVPLAGVRWAPSYVAARVTTAFFGAVMGRSSDVAMPGLASTTYGMALTTRMAVA